MDAKRCNQKCIRVVVSTTTTNHHHYVPSSLSIPLSHYNSTYRSLAIGIRMIIYLFITHLHLSCHLVQSFSEFGVVLPVSHYHCTLQRKAGIPSRKIVEPWKRVRLSLASFPFSCLNCARGGHTGDSICQLSLCPCQFPTHLEPLDSLVDLSLL
jgi:hypothetical protein